MLYLVGAIGIILYSSLLSLSIYQIVLYFDKKTRNENHIFYIKLYFHLIFGIYSLFDLLYYISLYFFERYTQWGYALHLMSLLINLFAFSLVIYLWRITLDRGELQPIEQFLGILFLGINILSTIVDLSLWCNYNQNDSVREPEAITTNLIYVCSILLVTCYLLLLGRKLTIRLKQSRSSSSSPNHQVNDTYKRTMSILRRVNIVLCICVICYGIRAFFLSLLTSEENFGETSFGQKILGMPSILWFILTTWIPTILPGLTFIYIMRYRPFSSTTAENSHETIRTRGGDRAISSSWYEANNQSQHVSVSSVTNTQIKLSKSLGWDDKRTLQFSQASVGTYDITTPFSSNTRLSFHSEASN